MIRSLLCPERVNMFCRLFLFIVLLICLVLAFCVYAYAGDWSRGWDRVDTTLQLGVTAAIAVDWMQTYKWMAHDETGLHAEVGMAQYFIGSHPSASRINTYFAFCTVGHALVSWALPKKFELFGLDVPARNIWQSVWIGIELDQDIHNYQAGVRIRW